MAVLAVEPTAGVQQKVSQSAWLISTFLGGKNSGRYTAKLAWWVFLLVIKKNGTICNKS